MAHITCNQYSEKWIHFYNPPVNTTTYTIGLCTVVINPLIVLLRSANGCNHYHKGVSNKMYNHIHIRHTHLHQDLLLVCHVYFQDCEGTDKFQVLVYSKC